MSSSKFINMLEKSLECLAQTRKLTNVFFKSKISTKYCSHNTLVLGKLYDDKHKEVISNYKVLTSNIFVNSYGKPKIFCNRDQHGIETLRFYLFQLTCKFKCITELRMTIGMFVTHLHLNRMVCSQTTNQKPKQYRQTL